MGAMWKQSGKDSSCERDPMLEQEKAERSSLHEEKAVTETICDGPSTTPILHPSVSLGRRGREFRSEVEPRKKGGVG